MQKAALLSLCPGSMLVALLTSSLVYIYQAYPTYSESLVTMILTIPNLTIIIGLFFAPVLAKKYSPKYIVIAGMLVLVAANVICAWVENFYLLVLLRAVSGLGAGLVLPLQATFFAAYPAKERATLMGLNGTVACFVAATVISISGIVATINWRYVFYLYMVNLISVVLVAVFVPKHIEVAEQQTVASSNMTSTAKLSDYAKVLFLYYFLLTGSYLFVSVLSAEMVPYLENVQLGGATESGLLLAVSMLGSVVSGLVVQKYTSVLKSMALPMVFVGSALGFVGLSVATNIIVAGMATVVLTFCTSMIAVVISYELSCVMPLHLFTTASAGVNFFIFALQFLSPMLCLALLDVVGGSFRTIFMMYAVVQAVMMVLAVAMPKVLLNRK